MLVELSAAAPPPNILFILLDDLGWNDYGCILDPEDLLAPWVLWALRIILVLRISKRSRDFLDLMGPEDLLSPEYLQGHKDLLVL